jgi:hypothetical protein
MVSDNVSVLYKFTCIKIITDWIGTNVLKLKVCWVDHA